MCDVAMTDSVQSPSERPYLVQRDAQTGAVRETRGDSRTVRKWEREEIQLRSY